MTGRLALACSFIRFISCLRPLRIGVLTLAVSIGPDRIRKQLEVIAMAFVRSAGVLPGRCFIIVSYRFKIGWLMDRGQLNAGIMTLCTLRLLIPPLVSWGHIPLAA